MSTPLPPNGSSALSSRGEPGPGSGRRGRDQRWQALAVCLVAGFMTLLDVSIVNVALPSVRNGLHLSESGVQWVLSGYSLAFGLALVPGGRLGDARSRRAVFMTGLALFTAASAVAGAAQNEAWLVGARLVQGMAGGVLVPQVSGFIQQLFRGPERGRAFGMLGATIGISTSVGPLLGGLLIEAFGAGEGWRWVFYVNLPIGLLALPAAYRLLPAPTLPQAGGAQPRRSDFDPVGVLLLGSGTLLLLLPFVQQQWQNDAKWLLVPVAMVLLALFVAWELRYGRRREPLVRMSLFEARSYSLGVLLSLVYFAGFTAIFFIFSLYLQAGQHYSALLAGLAITPFALGSGVSAAVGGRVVHRFGRPLVTFGLVLVVLGLTGAALAVHLWSGRQVGWATALPLLVAGVGSGLVVSPNQTLTLGEVPVVRAGSAGGVLQTAQRIGSAIGIAAVGSVFFSQAAAHHQDWAGAFQQALLVALAFVALALLAALADLFGGRARRALAAARP
ncbi:MFS transporter [Kitasatospora atroaurantiaca]|uniref:MFS transporter n=1 Tax=Kitasatospora atroaurantiaca TaxID=285545 RepID=UPI001FECC410|nr:MFS transporter [Kitasatospora atroaurantiaca]